MHKVSKQAHCFSFDWCSLYMQVQRLLELQSYLNGGISDWPAQMAEPLIKQEAPQAATHAESISPGDPQPPPSMPQQNNSPVSR